MIQLNFRLWNRKFAEKDLKVNIPKIKIMRLEQSHRFWKIFFGFFLEKCWYKCYLLWMLSSLSSQKIQKHLWQSKLSLKAPFLVEIEIVKRFRYLGDMISSGRACEAVIFIRYRTVWGKFKELFPCYQQSVSPNTWKALCNVWSKCSSSWK